MHLLNTWSTRSVSNSWLIRAADGTNIDNWTFDEIKEVVAEFVTDALKTGHENAREESKD